MQYEEKTTLIICEFISHLKYENISYPVIEKTRICLLDYLGASFVGMQSQEAALVREYVRTIGGKPQSSVFGMAEKTSMPLAAQVNGVTCHAYELDDAHRYATGLHPGATIIPAVLALGEHLSSSWHDLLVAIVAGYEMAGRVGRAINPSHRYRGFHSTGTVASLGAAAACSRLLGLGAEKTAWAAGIAGSSAGGIFAFLAEGSMNKLLHAGSAALNGVNAALLAQKGFTGPTSVLEGKEGFCRAFSDDYDLQKITRALGGRYEIEDTYFKRHASCGQAFGAIDAILEMREEIKVDQSEIRRITVYTFRAAAVLDQKQPDTIRRAKFSIPFVTALALLKGRVGHFDFTTALLQDSDIIALADKVEVLEDEGISSNFPEKRTAVVTLELLDGTIVSRKVDIPRGMPENPLSTEELTDKFTELSSSMVGLKRSKWIVKCVLSDEPEENIYSLMSSV
ncbi:MAG: MmgE/PrpD family protein [Desulfobacterales bacterium]|nr:MmgE/PrpD family protein [Desulfobacterales bacterium]